MFFGRLAEQTWCHLDNRQYEEQQTCSDNGNRHFENKKLNGQENEEMLDTNLSHQVDYLFVSWSAIGLYVQCEENAENQQVIFILFTAFCLLSNIF